MYILYYAFACRYIRYSTYLSMLLIGYSPILISLCQYLKTVRQTLTRYVTMAYLGVLVPLYTDRPVVRKILRSGSALVYRQSTSIV
jgi:hypothetical protein